MFRCHSLMTCLGLIILAGCSTPFHDARQLETTQRLEGPYFQPYATSIEYPDVDSILSDELSEAPAPRTLENPDELTPRPLGLEEAIRMALSSSDIIRTLGGTVVQAPGATTVYDIGLTESDPGASVEAALSAFDARWTSNLNFTHSERPVNQPIAGLVLPPFQQKGSTFVGELAKTTASGITSPTPTQTEFPATTKSTTKQSGASRCCKAPAFNSTASPVPTGKPDLPAES